MQTGSMLEPILRLLRGARVSDITQEQHVCVLHEAMSLRHVLTALGERRILSAPVLGGGSSDPQRPVELDNHGDSDILGFIDVRDILIHFLRGLNVEEVRGMKMLKQMSRLEAEGAIFCEKCVRDIATWGADGHFLHSSKTRLSLWEVVYSSLLHPERRSSVSGEAMNNAADACTSAVHHRLAIFNSKSQLTQVISQSDIIRFIHRHRTDIKPCLEARVLSLPGLCSRSVITLHANKSAFEALVIMSRYDISAVAVVNSDGRLVGNFSMSEMRSIMADHFGALALPVGEFLALSHGTEYAAYGIEHQDVRDTPAADFLRGKRDRNAQRMSSPGEDVGQPMAFLREDATFGALLDALVRTRVHRTYIVDADDRPIAVVTLTDILHAIAGEPNPERPRAP